LKRTEACQDFSTHAGTRFEEVYKPSEINHLQSFELKKLNGNLFSRRVAAVALISMRVNAPYACKYPTSRPHQNESSRPKKSVNMPIRINGYHLDFTSTGKQQSLIYD
jgi:hypothetical protein